MLIVEVCPIQPRDVDAVTVSLVIHEVDFIHPNWSPTLLTVGTGSQQH